MIVLWEISNDWPVDLYLHSRYIGGMYQEVFKT